MNKDIQQGEKSLNLRNRGIWTAVIFGLTSLAFFIFALTQPRYVWHDYLLTVLPGVIFFLDFICIFIILRNRLALGVGIVYVGNLMLAVSTSVFQLNMWFLVLSYISLTSILVITSVLPKSSRLWAFLFAIIAAGSVGIVEWLNPEFRVSTPDLLVITPYITGIMAVAFFVLLFRQAWYGTVSIKLLSVVIALLLVAIFFQTGRKLTFSIESLVPAVLIALLSAVGMFFVINQVVIRPVNHLFTVAQKQLSGDRSARVEHFPPDEFGLLGRTFNELSSQLDTSIRLQEQIIEARTRAIETSSNVSRRLSTILDQDELVMTVVNEVQLSFNYYHAQIYLLDENRRILAMVGGTGEAGRIMLSRGHNVPVGRGLVGRVAEGNTIVLVPDTTQDPNWLPNPLLPETRSEIALPIAIGDQVLGVLDIQHNIVNGFAQQDEDLLRSIANQVAIAIQNARSFMVVQKQAEQQELINRINQQIQMATSVESVLQIAALELGRALDARQVSAHIGHVDSGENQSEYRGY